MHLISTGFKFKSEQPIQQCKKLQTHNLLSVNHQAGDIPVTLCTISRLPHIVAMNRSMQNIIIAKSVIEKLRTDEKGRWWPWMGKEVVWSDGTKTELYWHKEKATIFTVKHGGGSFMLCGCLSVDMYLRGLWMVLNTGKFSGSRNFRHLENWYWDRGSLSGMTLHLSG